MCTSDLVSVARWIRATHINTPSLTGPYAAVQPRHLDMTSGKLLKTYAAATLASLSVSLPLNSQAAVTYNTRALTGQDAPGAAPGVMFSSFGRPSINSAGQIAFKAELSGTGVDSSNDAGIWSEGSGSLQLVVREGNAAPGTEAGVVFQDYSSTGHFTITDPAINDAGRTAFRASLSGPDIYLLNLAGIWSDVSGPLSLIARLNDPAPDTSPDAVFAFFSGPTGSHLSLPHINAIGQIAFDGYLVNKNTLKPEGFGIWSVGPDSSRVIVRTGDAAPGTAPGTVFGGFDIAPPYPSITPKDSLNDAGHIAFFAYVTGPGIHSNHKGLWSEGGGSLHLVAREDDPAPGTGPDVAFDEFHTDNWHFNNAGQMSFTATIDGAGVDATNNQGFWLDDAGSVSLVARTGDQAPGMDPGVVFSNLGGNSRINNEHVFLFSEVSGPGIDSTNNSGIWTRTLNSLQLTARTGTHAPGTEPDTNFSSFYTSDPNNNGQLVIRGTLAGPSIDNTNDTGIWVTNHSGELDLIIREGDPFDVDDDPLIDDFRTITSLFFFNDYNDLNNAGQLAFNLHFTDGTSGIFVATIGLPGDLNGDGFVGINDLNLVLSNWNQNVTPGDTLAGDATGDGYVGIDDLNTVLPNWNAGTPPSATPQNLAPNAPEPASLLILTSLLGLQFRRV